MMQNVDFWMKNDEKTFHIHLERDGPSKLNMRVGWKDGDYNAALNRREVRGLAARGKSPDSSDYRSFRNLTWRWFIEASGKLKTSNRAINK